MERVKKGEKYWYIGGQSLGYYVEHTTDIRSIWDDKRADSRNYFRTKEEAESMVRKFRAVLKGADVIKMPSEEDEDREISRQMEMTSYRGEEEDIYTNGFLGCIYWLKSKIVK